MTTSAPFAAAAVRTKPLLRGVTHEIAFYVSLLAGSLLVRWAPSPRAAIACAVYAFTMSALYGISALYHRPNWSPARRRLMQRLDHSAIFLLIAGTYTPVFALVESDRGLWPLYTVWIGAALGIAKSLLWAHAPKPVTAGVCLIVGWAAVRDVAHLAGEMGPTALWLLVAGGVIYSAGAIVYATRRPDPIPSVFGYHEIFHAMVIVASVVHFAHVITVVRLAG